MQILSSFIVNVVALGTGASYGIANVLVAKLDETEFQTSNKSSSADPFWFTINPDEASWIGITSRIVSLDIYQLCECVDFPE